MLMACYLFVFLIFFEWSNSSFAALTWRYYPMAASEFGYFTTRTKFILDYTGSDVWGGMRWYHHDDCDVDDQYSSLTTAQCTTAGYHQFGIINQSDDPTVLQSILVTKSPFCYKWQLKTLPSINSTSPEYNLKFRLWIAKMDQLNSEAPSEFSRRMTRIFHKFGLSPLLSASFGHSNDEEEISRHEISFTQDDSVWEVKAKILDLHLLKLRIDGPPISFLDCFVKPTSLEIQHKKFNSVSPTSHQMTSHQEVTHLLLDQDHCFPNVIAATINNRLYLTQDYFLSTPSNLTDILQKNNISSINQAIFSHDGQFLLHTGAKTFLMDTNSSAIHPVQGLPRDQQLQFSSFPWCHEDHVLPHETSTDVFLAWTNTSSLYISFHLSSGFTSLSFPSHLKDKDFRLLDVKVNGICQCVYFLIELSHNFSKTIVYTTHASEENIWGNVHVLFNDTQYSSNDSSWSFQFLPPNTLSFLLWNTWDMFYISAEGDTIKAMMKKNITSSLDRQRIIDVTTSNTGEYLVLYERNDLYYGRIGMDYMVQMHSRFSVEQAVRMLFDLNGYLYAVTVENEGKSLVARTTFPLDSEIFNALYPAVICPFLQFSFGSSSLTNIVDKWGRFQIWGYLVFKRSQVSNDIQLVWNPTNFLRVSVSERKAFDQDVIILNKTFTFSEQSPRNTSSTNSTLSFSATLIPKLNGMTCRRPFHKVFHFHAGCPPPRRAVLGDARFTQNFSSHEPSTFPIHLVAGEAFQYVLLMYDGNVLIKQVHSPFELTEVSGRLDYMVLDQGEGEPAAISFQGTGSFQFLLVFYDRNTSFCRSTAEFSVVVEDEREPDYKYIELACVSVITILFINLLVADYLTFRKSFMQRHEEDDDAKQRLQELQYLAQLQYYRENRAGESLTKPTHPTTAEPADTEEYSNEDTKRRSAVMGKSERRGHRRSSIFERVSKGVFEDLKEVRRETPAPSIQDLSCEQRDTS